MSMRPKRSSVRRTISAGTRWSVRSPGTASARGPSAPATSWARASSRTFTATDAPREYRRAAADRPRPRQAPVTMATRPVKSTARSVDADEPHERPDRIVEPIDDALLERDDRVVGDGDPFRADGGAALGDVAEADAVLGAQLRQAIGGVERVHLER